MTFCNGHTCSPGTFPCVYMKCTFSLHLENFTLYSVYKHPPKYISHLFPMQLLESSVIEIIFKRVFFSLFL